MGLGNYKKPVCVCVCGHWSSLVRSEKTLWPVGCSWIRKLSSINKCFVKKTVSNPSMIADSTKVIFATWKKKDSKFQTCKAFFFFLINELWMWLWCDPAYWLYNTIQYNTMRQIEIKILLWCPHAMDGATASLVTIDLMEQCDESDSSYRLIVSKQRGSEK